MFGIGLNNLIKIGFRVSDHILKQQEIERSRTASERARLQAEASREKHPYMTTGKTIALTRWTLVGKVMSLLLNMLSGVGNYLNSPLDGIYLNQCN